MADLPRIRSLLFFPGSDERKLSRALASDADAIVADLEDAVPPDQKHAARRLVLERFSSPAAGGPARLVRVNACDSDWGDDDLAAVEGLDLAGIVVPKADPASVAWAAESVGDTPLIAVIETALGLRSAFEVASASRVQALQLGAADLGAELGWTTRPDGQELLYARSKLVVDAAAARIRAPIDVVHLGLRDAQGLAAACELARTLGMRGKACIHPEQVEIVNRSFTPAPEEVAWAREVVSSFNDAVDDGRGAFLVRGALVDLPILLRARSIIDEAEGGSS